MTTSSPSPRSDLAASLEIIEVKPGKRFSKSTLQYMLRDTEAVLFFGKLYELNISQLRDLLMLCVKSDVVSALFGEGHAHSTDLQDYLVDICHQGNLEPGELGLSKSAPKADILPAVWDALEVEVAQSIKDVAAKLESVVGLLPGKQGSMVFQSMMTMNAKRPTLGDHRARITHARQKENLLILDVSGSMTEGTIRRIVDDVVALSYKANAHLAIVSNTCTYWVPGSYDSDAVLRASEFGGTHYEELTPLFDRDWGVVITVADYDSSYRAKQRLASCKGSIDTLLDLSLVNQPTFLAECVGQLANEVRPLLIAPGSYVLSN